MVFFSIETTMIVYSLSKFIVLKNHVKNFNKIITYETGLSEGATETT